MIFIIGIDSGPPADSKPLHVLIVDDDQDIHDTLTEIIADEKLSIRLQHAFDGHDALNMMREECPDLLILDIRMPTMDGLALREEMLHDPKMINVQIAVFTGHAMTNTELQVLLADYYIPKPTHIEALLTVLKKARENLSTLSERTQRRQEAAIGRLDTIIEDLRALRHDLSIKLKKPG